MNERANTVTFQGSELSLSGGKLSVGEQAPEAVLLADDLTEVKLSGFRGKVCVILSVPSLDTPVCDIEIRRFNTEAAALGDDVMILAVSMDLPFAQKRWCGGAGVKAVRTLSDHRDAAFGKAYGMLIKELRLLGRAVFVMDRQGVIQYLQIVREITDEPDYEAALNAIRNLL